MTALAQRPNLLARVPLRWWLALALFVTHTAFFAATFELDLVSDLPIHAEISRVGIDTGTWWGPFLPYLTAAVLAGWQADITAINVSMTIVLGVAVAAKYLISVRIARRELAAVSAGLLLVVALLSFAFSLPTDRMYLGQLPPNTFHNSTTIFLMPFALLLFWFTAQFLRSGDTRQLWGVAIAGALNVAAKPSFAFAVLAVFPVAALLRFRLTAPMWRALGVTTFVALLVGLQYLYIYESGATEDIYRAAGFGGEPESSVEVDPFHVWSHFSSNVLLSLLASLAFPLVALALYRRELLGYDLFRYAAALTGVSLLIFVLFTETGIREFQGNFAWQAMVSNYILFLTVLIRVYPLWSAPAQSGRHMAAAGAFSAHVLAGGAFLTYYLASGSYF